MSNKPYTDKEYNTLMKDSTKMNKLIESLDIPVRDSGIYHEDDAIKIVEALEGKLTKGQKELIRHEGFGVNEYSDHKGNTTKGVGSTGEFKGKRFKDVYEIMTKRASKVMDMDLDTLPEQHRDALISGAYRGDLNISPVAVSLYKNGQFQEAGDEFIKGHKDYEAEYKKTHNEDGSIKIGEDGNPIRSKLFSRLSTLQSAFHNDIVESPEKTKADVAKRMSNKANAPVEVEALNGSQMLSDANKAITNSKENNTEVLNKAAEPVAKKESTASSMFSNAVANVRQAIAPAPTSIMAEEGTQGVTYAPQQNVDNLQRFASTQGDNAKRPLEQIQQTQTESVDLSNVTNNVGGNTTSPVNAVEPIEINKAQVTPAPIQAQETVQLAPTDNSTEIVNEAPAQSQAAPQQEAKTIQGYQAQQANQAQASGNLPSSEEVSRDTLAAKAMQAAYGNNEPKTEDDVRRDALAAKFYKETTMSNKERSLRENLAKTENHIGYEEYKAIQAAKAKDEDMAKADTLGDKKQVELKHSTTQEELATISEENTLAVAGMTEEEIEATKISAEEYAERKGYKTNTERSGLMTEHERLMRKKERTLDAKLKRDARAAHEEKTKNALFDQSNGFIGRAGNMAVGTASGFRNLAGDLINAPVGFRAKNLLKDASDADIAMTKEIVSKKQAGLELTEEEEMFTRVVYDETGLNRFDRIKSGLDAERIRDNINRSANQWDQYVDHTAVDELSTEMAGAYNKYQNGEINGFELAGAALAGLASNPTALGQVTAESLPSMLAAAVSMPGYVAVAAQANYDEMSQEWAKEHGGRPDEQQQLRLTQYALGAAMVDLVGDRAMGKASGVGKRAAFATAYKVASKADDIAVAAGKEAKNVAKLLAPKDKTAIRHVVREIGRVGGSASGEFVAEGGSDVLSQMGVDKKDGVDYAQSFAAGTLGFGAGGITGSAGAATSTAIEGVKAVAKKGEDYKNSDAGQRAAAKKEKATEEKKASAIKAEEVAAKKKAKETLKEKTKTAARDIVYSKAIKTGDEANLPQEGDKDYDIYESHRAIVQIARNNAASSDGDTAFKGKKSLITSKRPIATSISKLMDEVNVLQNGKKLQKNPEALKLKVEQINKLQGLLTELTGAPADVKAKATEAVEAAKSGAKGSRDLIMNSVQEMKLNPTAFGSKELHNLYKAGGEQLTAEDKVEIKAAIKQAKTIESVSSDVREGSYKDGKYFKGLNEYVSETNLALASGNTLGANDSIVGLETWIGKQEAKMNQGYDKKGDGVFVPHEPKTLNAMSTDLAAMNSVLTELKAKIGNTKTTTESNKVATKESKIEESTKEETTPVEEVVSEAVVETNTTEEVETTTNNTPDEATTQSEGANASEVQSDVAEETFVETEEELEARAKAEQEEGETFEEEYKEDKEGQQREDILSTLDENTDRLIFDLYDEGVQKELAHSLSYFIAGLYKKGYTVSEIKAAAKEVVDTHLNNKHEQTGNKAKRVINRFINNNLVHANEKTLGQNLTEESEVEIKHREKVLEDHAKYVLTEEYKALDQEAKDKVNKTAIKGFNWLKAFFKAGNNKNIIQNIAGVFSEPAQTATKVATYIDRTLTKEDVALLEDYEGFRKNMGTIIDSMELGVEFKDGYANKPVSMFTDEKGNLDPEVKEAMILALYNYIATDSKDTIYNDVETINKMVGMPADAKPSNAAVDILKSKGVGHDLAIETLGKSMLSTINITDNADAAISLKSNMIGSLGHVGLTALTTAGYMEDIGFTFEEAILLNKVKANAQATHKDDVVPVTASEAEINAMKKANKGTTGWSTNTRVTTQVNPETKRDMASNIVEQVSSKLKESNQSKAFGEKSMWSQMFSNFKAPTAPSTKVPTTVATKLKNTNKKVTPALRKTIEKHQKRKHHLRVDQLELLAQMDKEQVLKMNGVVDPSTVPAVEVESTILKNESIERSYNNLMEFYNELAENEQADAAFYFTHDVWKNNRLGIKETLVNPQADKFHRSLIFQAGWSGDIQLKGFSTVHGGKQHALLKRFWHGLHETLDIKSEEDLQSDSKAELRFALSVVLDMRANKEVSESDMNRMVAYTATEAGPMTFDALNQLAKLKEAQATNAKSFNTNLGIELDGKTNGVIFSIQQYGAYDTPELMLQKLAKGGVFAKGSDWRSVAEFGEDKSNKDAYQEIGFLWDDLVNNVIDSEENQEKKKKHQITVEKLAATKSVFDFSNAKFLRNLSKNPLLVTTYGASAGAIIRALQDEFIGKIYKDLSVEANTYNQANARVIELRKEYKANKGNATKLAEIKAEAANLKKAMSDSKAKFEAIKYNVAAMLGATPSFNNVDITNGNTITMNYKEVKALSYLVKDIYGSSVVKAIEANYSGLTKGRKKVIESMQVMNSDYISLRSQMIDKRKEELKEQGLVVDGTNHISKKDLAAIEYTLRKIRPQMSNSQTPLDAYGDPDSEYTIDLAKEIEGKSIESTDNSFNVYSKFHMTNANGKRVRVSRDISAGFKSYDDTGVAPGVISIHMLDALVMEHMYNQDFDSLGVHDANYFGVFDVSKGGQQQNTSFYDVNRANTVSVEALKVFNNAKEMTKIITDEFDLVANDYDDLQITIVDEVTGEKEKIGGIEAANLVSDNLEEEAVRVKDLKDDVLDEVAYVDQYNDGYEDSSFKIEPTHVYNTREEAAKDFVKKSIQAVEDFHIGRQDGTEATTLSRSEQLTNFKKEVNANSNLKPLLGLVRDEDVVYDPELDFIDNLKETLKNVDLRKVKGQPARVKNVLKLIKSGKSKEAMAKRLDFAGTAIAFGSTSSTDENVNPNSYDYETTVSSENSGDVFDALPNSTGKKENDIHKAKLRETVYEISNKLVEPFNMYMRNQKDVDNYGIATESEIFITNLVNKDDNSSGLLAQGVRMSLEEIMAHEMTHLLYQEGLKRSSMSKTAVERMFHAAKEQLDYTIFLDGNTNPMPEDIENAQATYDYIFHNSKGNHLDEFAAFGMTNELFAKALNTVSVKPTKIFHGSAYQQISNVLRYLVEMFSDALNKTKGSANDVKLVKLMDNMLRVNASKESMILRGLNTVISVPAKGVAAIVNPMNKMLSSLETADWVVRGGHTNIQAFGVWAANKGDLRKKVSKNLIEYFGDIRTSLGDQKTSLLSSVISETIGRTAKNAWVRDLARLSNQMIDIPRKQVKTNMIKNLRNAWHTDVSESESKSLNKMMLKLDMVSLMELGNLSLEEVHGLIDSDVKLQAEIDGLVNRISSFNNSSLYLEKTQDLGQFMVTGSSKLALGMQNAHNIATAAGHPNIKVRKEVVSKVTPMIDQLATLYGIQATSKARRAEVSKLISREINASLESGETDGVTNLLYTHHSIKEDSKLLFNDKNEHDVLAIKGYTKEDYREDVGVTLGTAEDHDNLVAQGYIKVGDIPVKRDMADPLKNDPDAELFMYKAPNGALAPYMSGIVSLTNLSSKGTDLAKVNDQVGVEDAYKNASKNVREMTKRKLAGSSVTKGNNMIPVISPLTGNIVDYRYMMNEVTKDNMLDKENDVFTVMGSMVASNLDKQESAKINNKVVVEAKEAYDTDSNRREVEYMVIGPLSTNEDAREIWNLLPQGMKNEISDVWGHGGMKVRKEELMGVFGTRAINPVDMFTKDVTARNLAEKLIVDVTNKMLGEKSAYYVSEGFDVIKNVIAEVKDLIVVRSVVVTLANMLSNTLGLIIQGVSPVDAIKFQYEAFNGLNEFNKDLATKQQLELRMKGEPDEATARKINAEISRLNRRMAGNPVKITYDAGLVPNIVDDISADTELGKTKRSRAQKAISQSMDKYLPFLPAFGKDILKGGLGLPDSSAYKALNTLTMQSDFMARHAMLKNNTLKAANNGTEMTQELFNEMVGEVEEVFINFNAPTHKGIQFLNDIGVAWFTKFNIRVIKSIMVMFRDNPTRLATSIIAGELLNFSVIDNSIVTSLSGIPLIETFANPIGKVIDSVSLIPAVNLVNG